MVPYEAPPIADINIDGGHSLVLALDFPSRAIITKIIVVQTEGVADGFTVELFNHHSVLTGDQASDSNLWDDRIGHVPLDCFMVASPFVVASDRLRWFAEEGNGGHGYSFFNQDKPEPGRQLGNVRKLYVRIAAGGNTPSKRFSICVGGDTLE